MVKKHWIGVVSVLLIVGAGVGYYFVFSGSDYGDPRPPKDLTGIIVPPVEVSMKGQVFQVPNTENIYVTLDLVAPTAKRDYPMGRYDAGDDVTRGTLVALDDFTTDNIANKRTVPIAVNQGGSGEFFYLAILEDDGSVMRHATSVPLGDRIKIQSVNQTDNQVSVTYLVHDRNQPFSEVPHITTTAIIDVATATFVQEGRKPWLEEVIEVKTFTGEYLWRDTKLADGNMIVPDKPEAFTLTFDANRMLLGTDCNSGSATFTAGTGSSTEMKLAAIAATKMFCDSAQEGIYFDMIGKIITYSEAIDGHLAFQLSDDSVMTFAPKKRELQFENTTSDIVESGE